MTVAVTAQAIELDSKGLQGLVTAEDLATKVSLSLERIMELTAAGYLPCWFVDGRPFYRPVEVRDYVARHLVAYQRGTAYPSVLPVLVERVVAEEVPWALRFIADRLVTLTSIGVPGVYFLLDGHDVVYVGQSTDVAARIATHRAGGEKTFDRACYLPLTLGDLLEVERAFIRVLRPTYNRNGVHSPGPPDARDAAALSSCGWVPQDGGPHA